MTRGWDTSSANGYSDILTDKQLIATLKQAGNWHCNRAARRLQEMLNQADTDRCTIALLKQDVVDASNPEFRDRLENAYKEQIESLTKSLLTAMNEINALKDALAQSGLGGFEQ